MDAPDPDALLVLATDVAVRAGALALSMREGIEVESTKSTPTDVVTAADAASERLVVEQLLAARPHDAVLGEEGTDAAGTSGVRWVVDPVDGTVNFLYGIPQWCVSIAAEVDGEVVAGVVHDPSKDETWTAVRGGGARLNGRTIRCTDVTDLSQALVATGFSYDAARRGAQARHLVTLLPRVRDIRRFGAGALDLCSVAAGRADGYFEQAMNYWDWAAGALVAREAGARVSGLRGRPESSDLVVAAGPGVFDALHDLLVELDADADPLG